MFDKHFRMWYYVQAIRETASKYEIKIFQKSFKNREKMLDNILRLVVIYTSCPRESGWPELKFGKRRLKME